MGAFDKLLRSFDEQRLEMVKGSWCLQDREEKRLRMRFVLELAAELRKVRETTEFATSFGEMAIEAIIEGDWRVFNEVKKDLTFEHDNPEVRERYALTWASFRDIMHAALMARQSKESN